MIEIKSRKIKNSTVTVPGSKSYTHRMLIGAALSDGICRIENCLVSEDTILTQTALKQMGVSMDKKENGVNVKGCGGNLHGCEDEIYLGNSGTSMRLLAAVASLGKGTYRLTGNERMQQRPIKDLIDGLKQLLYAIFLV